MRAFLTSAALAALLAAAPAPATAQAAPYTEGSVWDMTFVRTRAGMDDDYLNNLRAQWKRQMDEAKRQGLVLSYRVIGAPPANRDDWDLMLITEYRNMAALDQADAKFRAIAPKLLGTEQEMRTQSVRRAEIREILGEKVGRELILKDSAVATSATRP
ncbi:MAG TPA: hypothetical protein VFY16_11800 [Gemmatimonadaceae bacterium]|nr:hypothetical protein [Gemmatimonadaceae bacterium]